MVTIPTQHPVEWQAPSLLWDKALADSPQRDRFRQPALLRFATDQFMAELMAALPAQTLANYVARPETHEAEAAGWMSLNDWAQQTAPLKLYQPAHNRFYLVAASLVCRIPGLPDRALNPANGDKATMVMRRLHRTNKDVAVDISKPETYVEQGWEKGSWVTAAGKVVLTDEERLPLFPLNYQENDRQRRLLAGFVPTASRETYNAPASDSPLSPPGSAAGEEDPRPAMYVGRVQTPLADLLKVSPDPPDPDLVEISQFLLLDFAEFLHDYMPAVWTLVETNSTATTSAVYNALKATAISYTDATKWSVALKTVYAARTKVIKGEAGAPAYKIGYSPGITEAMIEAELPAYTPPTSITDPPELPKLDPHAGDLYWLRCVYERAGCKLHEAVVSEPTQAFQIAPFFDPDAPVRQVRIVMPADTSIRGLRRYKKSVSFIVSDQLRNQMERFRGITMSKVEDGQLASPGGFSLGMICSLSIPIITICAFVLLLIIVQLLNIVFWWLPFLKICFPIVRRK